MFLFSGWIYSNRTFKYNLYGADGYLQNILFMRIIHWGLGKQQRCSMRNCCACATLRDGAGRLSSRYFCPGRADIPSLVPSCPRMATSSSTTTSSPSESGGASSSDEMESTTRAQKRARYSCTFNPDSTRFPWAKVSRKGPTFAYCGVCSRDISVAYGGTKDLCKHENRAVHTSGTRSVACTSALTSYFNQPGPRRMESVIEAEVKFGFFLAEHYLAFNIADHCSKLFPSLFHDSAIAKAFKCGRTKATAIVKVLAKTSAEGFNNHSSSACTLTKPQI